MTWRERRSMTPAEVRDVSNDVGVSVTSLSAYFEGRGQLSERTEQRVRDSVAALGLGTVVPATKLLGLVLPDLSSPYFSALAHSVERHALDVGWETIVATTGNDVRREIGMLSVLDTKPFIGSLLFTNNGGDARISEALIRHSNAVAVGELVRTGYAQSVVCDYAAMGSLAATHFLERGHRKFAYIGGPCSAHSCLQIGSSFRHGVRGALRSRRDFCEVYGSHSARHGHNTLLELSARGTLPTAILAGSRVIADGIMGAAAKANLSIPESFSLISCDGSGPLDLLATPLTSIQADIEELSGRSVSLLCRPRRKAPIGGLEKVAVTLIARRSTAALA